MASWLFTVTVLVVFAVALVAAIPVVRRRLKMHQETIAAEVWAADIIEGSDKPTESAFASQKATSTPRTIYRWDRIAIFGVGVASLLAAFTTTVLAPFTVVAWYIPVIFFGLTFSSLAILRYLAIQDFKKRKIQRRRTVTPVVETSQIVLKSQPREEKHDIVASESGAQQVKPIKHRQQKPVNYASKSLRYARTHHQAPSAEEQIEFKKLPSGKIQLEEQVALTHEETWEVRDTPRPTYLDTEVKYRSLEAPQLSLKEPDSSESASLKDAAEKAYAMNLDDVLSRRRAQ